MHSLEPPLQDAGVFPSGGDQVTVVMQEGNVGHVTAVAGALVAQSLHVPVCVGGGGTQQRDGLPRCYMVRVDIGLLYNS